MAMTTEEEAQPYNAEELEQVLLETPFVKEAMEATTEPITRPLRICCYGSSSARTPAKFLKQAWNLGYILAKRGHTCVNGAGSYGCMVRVEL
jgi:predicted Rossmann-fold nucleotide-binding protein